MATYPGRESKLLEFKSELPAFLVLIKTCIAFANAAGGRIIIGVDDSGEIIGIRDADREKIYEDFPNSLYDSTQPNLIAQIYEQNFNANTVMIIEIPASPRKPYFLKQKGIADGTYLRVGSSTRKANTEYIEDLVREGQRIHFDEESVYADTGILSKELLRQFYDSRVVPRRLLADKIITPKPANSEFFSPTIAGTLMFCETPERYIPEALIKLTQFQGTEGRNIIRTLDISGPLDRQSAEATRVLELWLSRDYTLDNAKLKGKMLVPKEAIREAILNAVIHRKYSIPGAIKIAAYEDRVEIFSPGCFPGMVDINSLGDGTTYLRNPVISKLAYHMHLIETRGTGIKLIFESVRKAGLRPPEYHEEGDFVKVIFYFEPDITQMESEEKAIMELLKVHQELTAARVAEYLKVSHNTAIRKLNDLILANQVKKIGKGRNIRYVVLRD